MTSRSPEVVAEPVPAASPRRVLAGTVSVLLLLAVTVTAQWGSEFPGSPPRTPVALGLATENVSALARAQDTAGAATDPNLSIRYEREQTAGYRNLHDVRVAIDERDAASSELADAVQALDNAKVARYQAAVRRGDATVVADGAREVLQGAAVQVYQGRRPSDQATQLFAGVPVGAIDSAGPHLYKVVLDQLHDALRAAQADLAAAEAAETEAVSAQERAARARDGAREYLLTKERALALAVSGTVGDGAAPMILGANVLTAEDLARYLREQGHRIAVAADADELARYYIDEGAAEGVRGDIAFAQSIIETGHFTAIAGGATGNNFAGIGACDGCGSGHGFNSVELGVRAQIQLLHTYADPELTADRLANPAVIDAPEHQVARGCCTTWADLTGVWASAQHYDVAVLGVYARMLASAAVARGL